MRKIISLLFITVVFILTPVECLAADSYSPSDTIVNIDISNEPGNGNYIQIYDLVFKNDGTESFEHVSSIVSSSSRGLSLAKTKDEDEYAIVDNNTQATVAIAVFADPSFFPNIIDNPDIKDSEFTDKALYKIRPSSKIKSNVFYPGGISGDSLDINGNNVFGEACKIKIIYGFRNVFRNIKYAISFIVLFVLGIFHLVLFIVIGILILLFFGYLILTFLGIMISSGD